MRHVVGDDVDAVGKAGDLDAHTLTLVQACCCDRMKSRTRPTSFGNSVNRSLAVSKPERRGGRPGLTPQAFPSGAVLTRESVRARQQVVPPGMLRRWNIELGSGARERLAGRPLFIRVKFFTSQSSSEGTVYPAYWEIGPPEGRRLRVENSLPAESFVEFGLDPAITADLIEPSGRLSVDFQNWNQQPLLFPLDDGMEVLYAAAFARGIHVVAANKNCPTQTVIAGESEAVEAATTAMAATLRIKLRMDMREISK
jgi:hypothetical protein